VLFLQFGTSIVAGALTLAIMTLPIIISTAEEALRAVPVEFRTVSASLGGTRWQGIRNIVLPQALPGHHHRRHPGAAARRGRDRAHPVHGGRLLPAALPQSPLDQTMALPYHLYVISTQVPGMPGDPVWHRAGAAGVGAVAEPGGVDPSYGEGSGTGGARQW
jgi:phosphate transport system permease protein